MKKIQDLSAITRFSSLFFTELHKSGETTECCPYVVGFLGVMSTGAPGEGMSIGNMSTHISILP